MKKYWITKDGDKIEYKKLTHSHLLNILKLIEKKAEEGMTIKYGGGGSEFDDFWYDEEHIEGEEVLERMDYKGLLKELASR